ncbi:hypothetical protein SEA_PINKCREEK_11 [Mycobacterium phage Pinkcreek]|nr:hypothetical protein SEA_PINKCREEK_11 [Mycobacterium phage Pinkcreek]
MSDPVTRAKAALESIGDGPWTIDSEDGEPIIHEAHHYDSADEWYDVDGPNGGWVAHCEDLPVAEFIAQARTLVPELVAEVERLRSYKSLPLDMVWQDYYSPDDVLKIRQPLDAEIEQLRAEVERLR